MVSCVHNHKNITDSLIYYIFPDQMFLEDRELSPTNLVSVRKLRLIKATIA